GKRRRKKSGAAALLETLDERHRLVRAVLRDLEQKLQSNNVANGNGNVAANSAQPPSTATSNTTAIAAGSSTTSVSSSAVTNGRYSREAILQLRLGLLEALLSYSAVALTVSEFDSLLQ